MKSQRWMFTSPDGEDEYKKPSVTRKHYDAVIEAMAREKSAETENERKRREFENLMWQRMTDSVRVLESIKSQPQQNIDELKKLNCSTYKESFVINGFKVKELGSEIDEKLIEKYPLYTDTAKSFWVKNMNKIKAKDPVHRPHGSMFRKDDRFTSRLSNPMDSHSSVGAGHYAAGDQVPLGFEMTLPAPWEEILAQDNIPNEYVPNPIQHRVTLQNRERQMLIDGHFQRLATQDEQ